ncbi:MULTISPECIES: hypothetical protein [unclassified Salmonella]
MGSFSIHSIGDSAFLEQILIAVSMITGTGDLNQWRKCAMHKW